MTGGALIAIALCLPIFAAVTIWFVGNSPNQRETVTLTTAVALLVVVLAILPLVLAGIPIELKLLAPIPGLNIAFAVEPLGMLFAGVASFLWIVNSIFSIGYMRGNKEPRQTRFYVCFAIAIAATIGLAFAENLFTLFICYEVLTLSTYPLVAHHKNDEARQAGRTYLGILLGSSIILFLPAIIATWVFTDTLSFTPGGIMTGKVPHILGSILLLLYLYGIGKAALMPIHRWLPAAMVAPENENPRTVPSPPVDTVNPASAAAPPDADKPSNPETSNWNPATGIGFNMFISMVAASISTFPIVI